MDQRLSHGGEWFESWFASPHYARLYAHRNEEEARVFLTSLLRFLKIPSRASVLDLACGEGRHSHFLAQCGYRIIGVDLSSLHIARAIEGAGVGETFICGDMRNFKLDEKVDVVLNLFTSFGYFQDPSDNVLVLKNVARQLANGGWFVLDYLNAQKVRKHLIPEEFQAFGETQYRIRRMINGGHVIKEICVNPGPKEEFFEERVQLFSREELSSMVEAAGMHVCHTFGSYLLNDFEPATSERVILVARKKD